MEKPKDLKIKIGSKDMAFWRDVIKNTEPQIEGLEKAIKLNQAILDMAKLRYKQAEAKWKRK